MQTGGIYTRRKNILEDVIDIYIIKKLGSVTVNHYKTLDKFKTYSKRKFNTVIRYIEKYT